MFHSIVGLPASLSTDRLPTSKDVLRLCLFEKELLPPRTSNSVVFDLVTDKLVTLFHERGFLHIEKRSVKRYNNLFIMSNELTCNMFC